MQVRSAGVSGQPVAVFLRAVNVGGNNRVPMAELRDLFDDLGLPGARTYVQSGNVAVRADVGSASRREALVARIEAAIGQRFGVTQPLALRTRSELAALEARNPYLAVEPDPTRVHVLLLTGDPTPSGTAKMARHSAPPDEFHHDGREVFIRYVGGAGTTKLRLDFGVPGTARNWRTILNMISLLDEF
jgi:uncharacterized protein (DUF1697 family)